MNKVIEDGLKHFRAKAARYRKLAEQAEAEVARLEALAQQGSQPTQRAADGAYCSCDSNLAINYGDGIMWCVGCGKPRR